MKRIPSGFLVLSFLLFFARTGLCQDILLHSGYNFISFNVNRCFYDQAPDPGAVPDGTVMVDVRTLGYNSLSEWLTAATGGVWTRIYHGEYLTGKYLDRQKGSLRPLHYITVGRSYGLTATAEGSFWIEGESFPGNVIHLKEGFNYIGYLPNVCYYYGSGLPQSGAYPAGARFHQISVPPLKYVFGSILEHLSEIIGEGWVHIRSSYDDEYFPEDVPVGPGNGFCVVVKEDCDLVYPDLQVGSLQIEPAAALLEPDATVKFKVTGNFNSGSNEDITDAPGVKFELSNGIVLKPGSHAQFTAGRPGTVRVTAETPEGFQAAAMIRVMDPADVGKPAPTQAFTLYEGKNCFVPSIDLGAYTTYDLLSALGAAYVEKIDWTDPASGAQKSAYWFFSAPAGDKAQFVTDGIYEIYMKKEKTVTLTGASVPRVVTAAVGPGGGTVRLKDDAGYDKVILDVPAGAFSEVRTCALFELNASDTRPHTSGNAACPSYEFLSDKSYGYYIDPAQPVNTSGNSGITIKVATDAVPATECGLVFLDQNMPTVIPVQTDGGFVKTMIDSLSGVIDGIREWWKSTLPPDQHIIKWVPYYWNMDSPWWSSASLGMATEYYGLLFHEKYYQIQADLGLLGPGYWMFPVVRDIGHLQYFGTASFETTSWNFDPNADLDETGQMKSYIKKMISQGRPVLVASLGQHNMWVITGYDLENVYVNDSSGLFIRHALPELSKQYLDLEKKDDISRLSLNMYTKMSWGAFLKTGMVEAITGEDYVSPQRMWTHVITSPSPPADRIALDQNLTIEPENYAVVGTCIRPELSEPAKLNLRWDILNMVKPMGRRAMGYLYKAPTDPAGKIYPLTSAYGLNRSFAKGMNDLQFKLVLLNSAQDKSENYTVTLETYTFSGDIAGGALVSTAAGGLQDQRTGVIAADSVVPISFSFASSTGEILKNLPNGTYQWVITASVGGVVRDKVNIVFAVGEAPAEAAPALKINNLFDGGAGWWNLATDQPISGFGTGASRPQLVSTAVQRRDSYIYTADEVCDYPNFDYSISLPTGGNVTTMTSVYEETKTLDSFKNGAYYGGIAGNFDATILWKHKIDAAEDCKGVRNLYLTAKTWQIPWDFECPHKYGEHYVWNESLNGSDNTFRYIIDQVVSGEVLEKTSDDPEVWEWVRDDDAYFLPRRQFYTLDNFIQYRGLRYFPSVGIAYRGYNLGLVCRTSDLVIRNHYEDYYDSAGANIVEQKSDGYTHWGPNELLYYDGDPRETLLSSFSSGMYVDNCKDNLWVACKTNLPKDNFILCLYAVWTNGQRYWDSPWSSSRDSKKFYAFRYDLDDATGDITGVSRLYNLEDHLSNVVWPYGNAVLGSVDDAIYDLSQTVQETQTRMRAGMVVETLAFSAGLNLVVPSVQVDGCTSYDLLAALGTDAVSISWIDPVSGLTKTTYWSSGTVFGDKFNITAGQVYAVRMTTNKAVMLDGVLQAVNGYLYNPLAESASGSIKDKIYTAKEEILADNGLDASTKTMLLRHIDEYVTQMGPIAINYGAAFTMSRTVNLSLLGATGAGITRMQFSNDNVGWSAPEVANSSKTWNLSTGDGTKTVYAKFGDAAGSWSAAASDTIVLDTVRPSTTASPVGGLFNATKTVTLTASDGTGSGVTRIYYTTDGTNPTTSSRVYSDSLTINATTTLKYCAVDRAGNMEAVKTQTYMIDTIAPTGTVIINDRATYTTSAVVTLTLFATDNRAVTHMQFSNDGVGWGPPGPLRAYATTFTWTITGANGTKTVYVRFKDAAGNWSVPATDTIILDTVAPVTTASPLGGTYTTAKNVTLTATDATSGPDKIYYTTNGTIPTTSSPVYSGQITISSTTTLKYFAIDKAGMMEAVKTQTYTMDTVAPAAVSILINGGATYTASTSVTLTLSATDNVLVTQMRFSNDGVTWAAPVTYATTRTYGMLAGDGTKTVYAQFKDAAGNWSAVISDTIVLDTVAPVTTASPVGGTYTTARSVILTATDATSGPDKIYYTIDGTIPTTSSPVFSGFIIISSTTTLKYFATDKAGKAEAVKTQYYLIDTIAPTGSIIINGGATYTTTSVTLTLSATDNVGVTQMRFSNDGATWAAPVAYGTTKTWALTAGNGTKTVYAQFKDAAGNWSAAVSDTIILDTVAPVTTASPVGGSYTAAQTVTLTATDATSGPDKIYYTTNGTTPTTSSPVYLSPLTIASITTLKYFATDKAGKIEAVKTQTYTIDTIAPIGAVVINAGATYTTATLATLTLSATDNVKATHMQFSNDGVNWGPPGPTPAYATTFTWTMTGTNGTKTVYARFKDAAGNWSAPATDTIILDTVAPVTTASPTGGLYNATKTVTLTATDATSGPDKIYYTTNGTDPTTSCSVYSGQITISSTTTLKYRATDKAGLIEPVKTQTYTIDTVGPTGSISINNAAPYTKTTAVTLNLSADAGVVQMRFSNDNITWSAPEAYAATKAWTLPGGDSPKTVYAKFADAAGNWSAATSDEILLDSCPPPINASPAGGTYTSAQTVTLSFTEQSGCTVYYTTNGATPTTSSPVYSGPITISATTTLKFFGVDGAGNVSAVKTETYNIVPYVAIQKDDATLSEPGTDTGTFKVLRTGGPGNGSPLTVYYTVSGTAVNGTDYVTLTGSVVFDAGVSVLFITVEPKDDTIAEVDETVTVTISPNANYLVASYFTTDTLTIKDND